MSSHNQPSVPCARWESEVAQLVVVLSGPVAAGKSTLARLLHDRYGGSLVKTQQALRER